MSEITWLDGGFGSMIQAAGLKAGEDPTEWNLTHAAAVTSVHRAYVEAGSDIVLTNTFGANRVKYGGCHAIGELVTAAVKLARASGADRVALDVGPTGRLLQPAGDLTFDAAYAAFAEEIAAGIAAGADLVFVETMGDLLELKAAVCAARDVTDKPVWASVTLGEDGKLLTGASVACVATLLESLGVAAYGFNCGLGPDRMLSFVRELAGLSTKPLIAKPNAGMPRIVCGKTVYDVTPEAFAEYVRALAAAGADVLGGCCGTTPAHIAASVGAVGRAAVSRCQPAARTCVSSGVEVVALQPHGGTIIGERINPTGKRLLKEAYLKGDAAYVLREAVTQVAAGAAILDVNCGVPGVDEAALLATTVTNVQSVVAAPVQVDTSDPAALARALRLVNGKPLINSVNGKRASMDAVFPLARRYGGVVVALCLDESGIPETPEGRLAIARRILAEGAKYGLGAQDFVFDALTLSVSADSHAARVTLETVRRLTEELGVNTVLGVSNVSFGLPNRTALNNAMYTLAKRAGLSAAIANPSQIVESEDSLAFDVLLGRDPGCARWIAANDKLTIGSSTAAKAIDLKTAIVRGLAEDARTAAARELAAGETAMAVVSSGIIPALEDVGRGFERGTVYLPQLLMAADAASAAFGVVRTAMTAVSKGTGGGTAEGKGPVVLATVKGDIHDIGKNIVRVLLESYGFEVVDLGRDVAPEAIVAAVVRTGAPLVGLSALMTTTVGAMAETVALLKTRCPGVRTVVGGAVVTPDFARSIDADFYAADAMRTVRIAEDVMRSERQLND